MTLEDASSKLSSWIVIGGAAVVGTAAVFAASHYYTMTNQVSRSQVVLSVQEQRMTRMEQDLQEFKTEMYHLRTSINELNRLLARMDSRVN